MRSVAIIILNYNGATLLAKNLDSVIAAGKEYSTNVEVIVADNGSTDNSRSVVEGFGAVKWLPLKENHGFGKGNNLAVANTKQDIVILVNTDVIMGKDSLAPLVDCFKDDTVFAVSCQQEVQTKEKTFIGGGAVGAWTRGLLRHESLEVYYPKTTLVSKTLYASGGASAYDREKFVKLGGFSAVFSQFYWEDTDLSFRAWKQGWKALYVPQSKVIHAHESTTSKVMAPWYRRAIGWRGQWLFTWRAIDDIGLLINHLFWLPIHIITALLTGKFYRLIGLFMALPKLFSRLPRSLVSTRKILQICRPNRLAIVSETIRRDLHAPLANFTKFDTVHFYKNASYADMQKEDFDSPRALQFHSMFDLYSHLKKYQPTHLQVPDPGANKTCFFASLICLRYWKKYRPILIMPFFENIPYRTKFNLIKYHLVVWATKRIMKKASAGFALNSGAKKNLIVIGVDEKKLHSLMWASWGINLNEFKLIPQIKNQKPVPSEIEGSKIKNLLFLGRVSYAKGIPQLLKMYEVVKKEVKDAKLIIAGPAGDASHLIPKKHAQEMHAQGACILGVIKNADVAQFFNGGAVTIMPSQTTKEWEEQVGMVGLQSLACGTPVITTTSGAIPEYFKNNQGAFLFAENDYRGMAETCIKLLTDQKFHQDQSQKGVRYIEDNYNVADNIKKIEALLLDLE